MTKHIAVFSFPAYAHVAPTLPVVAELVRRGHRVTFAAADRFVDAVAGTGAEVLSYESTFPWATGLGTGTGDARVSTALSFLEEGIAPLDVAMRRFADDRPDLVLHDLASSETARLLARSWELPIAQTVPMLASNGSFDMNAAQAVSDDRPPLDPDDADLRAFVDRARRLLTTHGLADVDIEGFGGDHGNNLVFLTREFQIAGETFDDRYVFVGPCLDPAAVPATSWTPPADGRPVVLISLGTSQGLQPLEFFRKCVRAFTGQPWHVVLTLGSWVHPADLEPLPDNIEAHRFIPHPAVLAHAKVFVTHAGASSVMESLYYDVPMVTVPSQVDQKVTAGRAAELGLGPMLDRGAVGERDLRAAIEETAADPEIRRRVHRASEQVRQAGGAVQAADAVERWAAA